jgi:hypothetical protein
MKMGITVMLGMSIGAGLTYTFMSIAPIQGVDLKQEQIQAPVHNHVKMSVGESQHKMAAGKLARANASDFSMPVTVKEAGSVEVIKVSLQERNLLLSQEVADLTQEVSRLNAKLSQIEQARSDGRSYDLSQNKLVELASRCELRWDMPSIGPHPTTVSERAVNDLALSKDEQRAVNLAFSHAHRQLIESIQGVYSEITGDGQIGSMSSSSMLEEIFDKTSNRELQAAFQRLARERAGLQDLQNAGQPQPPIERLLRRLTTAGDELEAALANEIGAERARAYRDLDNGWNSKHGSSYGCP